MMIDDLKDKFLDSVQSLKAKLEEHDAYLQIKEKYDSLPPLGQKATGWFLGAIIVYAVAQFPLIYYGMGSDNLALFEENRDLILNLYRVKRHAAATPQLPPSLAPTDLESRARNAVTAARVQPDQIKGISFFDNAGPHASAFIPKSVKQEGLEVRLANLNVNQVTEVGHALTTLSETAKLVGVEVKAGTLPGNYFDTTFKLVSFSIPTPETSAGKKGKK